MNPLHTFSRGRKWNIALQVVVAVAAFMAIVVMVNYLSARHFKRFHWSDRGSVALTPRTLALLQSMTNQVEVTVFFDSEAVLFVPVNQVLEEYRAASPNLTVRKVDLHRNPAAAQAVRTRYNLPPQTDDNLVIFDHAGRKRVISERMLTDKDYEQVPNADQIELVARHRTFKGELMFTSAIADVIAPRDYKAYFLAGHNEHDPSGAEAQMGYASFADLLALNNLRFDVLSLGAKGDIPDDCDLLIIAGPQQKFYPAELDRIEQYLNQGGRLLAMFSIGPALLTGTGLERLLTQWGVDVGANLVEDAANARQGQAVAFLTSRYGQHPIVSPLGDTRLQVLSTRTIAARREAAGLAGTAVTELVYTGTNAVVYTQFPDGQAIRTGRDPVGEFPLAVAVEKGGLPGVTTLRGGVTRIVVTGDSFMFGNQLLDYMGNRDFANQIINWLLDRSELMAGIGPRPMQDYQLALTPAQLRGVRLVLIAGLPLGALFVGFLVWLRRRS
jgi:ABC-2 type transport system permease protein